MENSFYKLLLRSFDVPLSEEERSRIDKALAASEEFRSRRQEISDLREKLRFTEKQTLKPFFTERLMERLRNPEQSIAEYFVTVFRSVAIGAAVLLVICTLYNVSRADSFTLDSALGISHPTLEQVLTLEAPFE